ncbi:hypothetical protein ACFWWA_20175 [Streptomyces goshikiensis]
MHRLNFSPQVPARRSPYRS